MVTSRRTFFGALILTTFATGCSPALQHPQPTLPAAPQPTVVIATIDTPIDLSGELTLDRAIALALERHPLRPAPGAGPVGANELAAHVRETRLAVSIAYGDYLRAALSLAAQERSVRLGEAIAHSIRSRSNSAPLDAERAPIETARVHMAVARAAWDLDRTRGALNALLARPADAPVGAPQEIAPRTVSASLDDLANRAMHNHAPDPHDSEAPLILRGTIDESLDQLQQLAREWDVLRTEALPHAETLRARLEAVSREANADFDALWEAEQMVTGVEISRAQIVSDFITAIAGLEHSVGESLETTALPSAPIAPEPSSAAPSAATASASPEPATTHGASSPPPRTNPRAHPHHGGAH